MLIAMLLPPLRTQVIRLFLIIPIGCAFNLLFYALIQHSSFHPLDAAVYFDNRHSAHPQRNDAKSLKSLDNGPVSSIRPPLSRQVTKNQVEEDDFSGVYPRVFQKWSVQYRGSPVPCFRDTSNGQLLNVTYQDTTRARVGLLFQKTPKCASTTSAGVALRIARNLARRMGVGTQYCESRFTHGSQGSDAYWAMRFQKRDRQRSFLWTMIREPTSRYLSNYFYLCATHATSAKGKPAFGCENFQIYHGQQPDDFYLSYLSTRGFGTRSVIRMGSGQSRKKVVREANLVVSEYDFIGIVERYEESLVVLMLLLDLRMSDVLYFSSKARGGLVVGQRGAARNAPEVCKRIEPTVVDRDLQTYLQSRRWKDRIRSDSLLYRTANRSLDLTIDSLGKELVDANVARLRHAQRTVTERCEGQVVMPCNREGDAPLKGGTTDCVTRDWGCGFSCLDQVATELELW